MKLKKLAALLLSGCLCVSAVPVFAQEMLPDLEETEDVEATLADTQEITFVLSNEPDGIDPGITNNSFASTFLSNCFEGLVTYDEEGNVVAGVAESWDISEDGTVYTFHLRDGLKWNDGSALTANDFVYSYKRVLDPATGGQYVNMLTDYVVGAAELYAGEGSEDDLGIKALDDQTLEITLIQPASWFIDMLTMWVWDPVQEATITANGDQWTNSPETYICDGPFEITDMSMG
jgi:oligopeptide transport system substrate-binding protein